MEKQLFDWKEWSEVDVLVQQFYNCVLKQRIGAYPIGTYFDWIVVDYEKGTIQLCPYKHQENWRTFKLNLTIGEEVNEQTTNENTNATSGS